MNNWILIAPMAAFAILALAGWLYACWIRSEFKFARDVDKKLAGANQQLYAENERLREEHKDVYAQNADLREEVQERRAECISLKLQLEEVLSTNTKPMQPSLPVKRVSRKKVEDGQ